MTELNKNHGEGLSSSPPTAGRTASSSWKRATVAGLLSLVVPGAGQLYNRKPSKALWLALPIPAFAVLGALTRILFVFFGMVAFFTIFIGWRLFIVGEAIYDARTVDRPEVSILRPRIIYPLVAVALIAAQLYPSYDQFKRWTSFAAFRVPSESMCPTICLGERIVADMGAYKSKAPQRGDIILLKHKSSSALFIKRVIGIPGDVVAPGLNGTIRVNGRPLVAPEVCGIPVEYKKDGAGCPMCQTITVQDGTFFVVGDNLGNSFDSRFPEFGAVVLDMIRGKPLYLYWSPSRSRIGCATP